MRVLADRVKVWDPKAQELRSVTRQSVDGMIAELEGRQRAPRKRRSSGSSGRRRRSSNNGAGAGRINPGAFGV